MEQLLLKHAPSSERERWYGYSQYRLLARFDGKALSGRGARRLEELRRKFGDEPPTDPHLVQGIEMSQVPPRIPDTATALMSDAGWLRAMRTVHRPGARGSGDPDWDQVTLSRQLEARTMAEPERFASSRLT